MFFLLSEKEFIEEAHWSMTNKYHQSNVHTRIRQFGLRIYGPVFWNSLPKYLTKLLNWHLFKIRLKVTLWICVFSI